MRDSLHEPVSVVIAALNEEESIGVELRKIKEAMDKAGVEYEIIVVDDGSTDNTRRIVEELDWVKLIVHDANKGYGEALKTGIRIARYNIIVITDVDGIYPNEVIDEVGFLVGVGGER